MSVGLGRTRSSPVPSIRSPSGRPGLGLGAGLGRTRSSSIRSLSPSGRLGLGLGLGTGAGASSRSPGVGSGRSGGGGIGRSSGVSVPVGGVGSVRVSPPRASASASSSTVMVVVVSVDLAQQGRGADIGDAVSGGFDGGHFPSDNPGLFGFLVVVDLTVVVLVLEEEVFNLLVGGDGGASGSVLHVGGSRRSDGQVLPGIAFLPA